MCKYAARVSGISRRRFLGTLGAAATTAAVGAAPSCVHAAPAPPAAAAAGGFGRLFPLPAFAEPSDAVVAALQEMGKPGGLMDARDPLERGPKALIADPALSAGNPDNPTHTAGTTFMGQFFDHDITFDATTQLAQPAKPEAVPNARSPRFDLDTVYGAGPVASGHLYDGTDPIKLRIESGGLFEDVPRREDGGAILGDPRNDANLMVAGIQAAFILFHNRVVDWVRDEGTLDSDADIFAAARRLTTWHYQWLIVHEFLPLFIGQPLVDDVMTKGPRFFAPAKGQAFIPIEFSGAAYRFGHSMVRPSYRANLAGDNGAPFFPLLFDPAQDGKADPDDLRGGARAPRRFIGWQTFFDFGDGEVKRNKRIDAKLSTPLFTLPLNAIASHDAPTSLAQRNLLRHLTWALPSGQAIALAMDVEALSPADLDDLAAFGVGFERNTPLWHYLLKEAEVVEDGLRLGPVGGRIVGEVFLGLLRADPDSYLAMLPSWRPTLPTRAATAGQLGNRNADFRMIDLLTFAGVDPASRGQ
ncbi:MAG TPA: heme peroxidase family protein [Thermomicrobiales bacterium]|nr:heme peroxidase family protein [Thermomicrobiales bacterium]